MLAMVRFWAPGALICLFYGGEREPHGCSQCSVFRWLSACFGLDSQIEKLSVECRCAAMFWLLLGSLIGRLREAGTQFSEELKADWNSARLQFVQCWWRCWRCLFPVWWCCLQKGGNAVPVCFWFCSELSGVVDFLFLIAVKSLAETFARFSWQARACEFVDTLVSLMETGEGKPLFFLKKKVAHRICALVFG